MRIQMRLEFRCDVSSAHWWEDANVLMGELKREIDAKFDEDSDGTNPPEWMVSDFQQVPESGKPQEMVGLNIRNVPVEGPEPVEGVDYQEDRDPGDETPWRPVPTSQQQIEKAKRELESGDGED